MRNRKVYVGYLTGAVDPSDTNDMIRLLPYMSGYRHSFDLSVRFTEFYDNIYKDIREGNLNHLNPSDFEVALPAHDIESIRLFDTSAYLRFSSGKQTS